MFKKLLLRIAKNALKTILNSAEIKDEIIEKAVKNTKVNEAEAGILYDLLVEKILEKIGKK